MKRQQGFTLIELVMVIIILGILAATAAPRFIDISRDAKIAVLRQLEASIIQGAENTYKMAILQNCHKQEKCFVQLGYGEIIEAEYGFPESRAEDFGDILDTIDADYELFNEDTGADFRYCFGSQSNSCSTSSSSNIRIGYDPAINGCHVRYIEPAGTSLSGGDIADDSYEVHLETNGC